MPSSNFKVSLDAALTKSAKLFRDSLLRKATSVGLPQGLDKATIIGNPIHTDMRSSIDVIIQLKYAPWARAFEYGSGEHGEEGTRYRIPSEGGGNFVAFPLERWPQYVPPPEKKYHYFPYVMHPGVKAKPYIEPTITETKKEIRNIFAKEIKAGLLAGVPKVTVIK